MCTYGSFDTLTWSPDNTHFAAMHDFTGPLTVWQVGSAEPQVYELPIDIGGLYLAWSPLGDQIVISSSVATFIYLWDVEQERVTQTLDILSATPNTMYGNKLDMQWSPNGELLALGTGSGLIVWEMSSGSYQPIYVYGEQVPGFYELAWSPDSRSVFSADFYGSIYKWDVETGCVLASHLVDSQS